ncbi:MAG: tyrosine-type recombinase/integrase [Syntrophomonadaceae bacterium]
MRGHLEKRGKDTWTIIIERGINPLTKKRERIKRAVQGTKPEVTCVMNEMLYQLQTGTYVEPTNLTFSAYLEHWLENYCELNLAPKTMQSYKMEIANHIEPQLGSISLEKLTPMHLQTYYVHLQKKGRKDKTGGLSPRTVVYHHRIIREALKHAFKWQLVIRNVADAVEPPRFKRKEMKVMSKEQVLEFIKKIEAHRDYAIIYVALYTGLRQGELLGLTWSNVDLACKTLFVRQQMQYLKGKGYIYREPKTPKSRREIPLSAEVITLLKEIHREQAQLKLMASPIGKDQQDLDPSLIPGEKSELLEYEDNDLVFCLNNGKPLDPTNLTKRFKKLARKHGHPEMRFHDMRHTFATLMLAAGVEAKKVQDLLGHESIGTTLDTYGHVLPNMRRDAMDRLSQFMGE